MPKVVRRKEIAKIIVKRNEIETKKKIGRKKKSMTLNLFLKINKMDKP